MSIKRKITAITKEQVHAILDKKFKGDEKIINQVLACDPTPNHGYSVWVAKLLLAQTIRLPEDTQKINEKLQLFEEFKKRGKIKGVDINQVKSYGELAQVVEKADGEKTKGEQYRDNLSSGTEEVYSDDKVKVIKVTTPEAAMEISKGTEWCTKGSDMATDYLKDGPLYVFIDAASGKKLAQYHAESRQLKDRYDNFINENIANHIIGAFQALKLPLSLDGDFDILASILSQKDPLMSPVVAYTYVFEKVKGRWPEGESVIAQNAQCAYNYARYIIHERFPEGEPVIAHDAYLAYCYADYLIHGRWYEAEPIIAQHAYIAYLYAKYIIKGRFPEAEPVIAQDAESAYWYAKNIIKGRFPEGEPVVARDTRFVSDYIGDFPSAKQDIEKYQQQNKSANTLSRVITAITKEQVHAILDKKFKGDEKIINQVIACDPTPNKGYCIWIAKLLLNKSIILPEDTQKIFNKIQLFEELKKRGKIKGVDINQLSSYEQLAIVVEKAEGEKTKGEQYRENLKSGVEEIYNDGDVRVLKVTTAEAIMELSKGTEWCTAGSNMATHYIKEGPFHLFMDASSGEKLALLHIASKQFKNRMDGSVDLALSERIEMAYRECQLPVQYYLDTELGDFANILPAVAKSDPVYSPATAFYVLEKMTEPKDDDDDGNNIGKINKKFLSELEDVISKDKDTAYMYAAYYLKGRFKKGESSIAKDAWGSILYAERIIKKRFPMAEPLMLANPYYACAYAQKVIKGRWPKAEPIIATSANDSFIYATEVIKGRFPKGEPALLAEEDWWGFYVNSMADFGITVTPDMVKKASGISRVITAITKEQVLTILEKKFKGDKKIINQVLACDPTPNHGYSIWIAKLLLNKSIILPEDSQKINEKLQLFEELKKRGKIKGVDINQVKSYGDLARAVEKAEGTKTKGETTRDNRINGAQEVYNKYKTKVIKVTTVEAAMELSKGTEWCTKGSDMATHYLSQGPLYFFFDTNNGEKEALAHPDSSQFKDTYDNGIESWYANDVFDAVCELRLIKTLKEDFEVFIDIINNGGMTEQQIDNLGALAKYELFTLSNPKSFIHDTKSYLDIIKSTLASNDETSWKCQAILAIAKTIINNSNEAELMKFLKKNNLFEPIEALLIQTPKSAQLWACYYRSKPWPEAEQIIATDGACAGVYRQYFMSGKRWPEAEPAFAKTPWAGIKYAIEIFKTRWPALEETIFFNYSGFDLWDVVKSYLSNISHWERLVDIEPKILSTPSGLTYAMIIYPMLEEKDRKELVDNIGRYMSPDKVYTFLNKFSVTDSASLVSKIAQSGKYSIEYARYKLHGRRFEEGEPAIISEKKLHWYLFEVIIPSARRCESLENAILDMPETEATKDLSKNDLLEYVKTYITDCRKYPWQEAEDRYPELKKINDFVARKLSQKKDQND